jgi:hypothetical protein
MVWKAQEDNGDDYVAYASRGSVTSDFTNDVPLTTAVGDDFIQPRIAVGADGTIAAAWKREKGASSSVEVRLRTPADGTFGPLLTVDNAAPQEMRVYDVVVDPSGAVSVIYNAGDAVKAAHRPAGGSFGTPVTLAPKGYLASLNTRPDGTGVALWLVEDEANDVETLMMAERSADGSFGPAREVARDEAIYDPGVSFGSGTDYAIHFGQERGSTRRGMIARNGAAPVEVAPQVDSIVAAIEPGGNVAALWDTHLGGGRYRVQTGGLDNGSAPVPGAVRVPESANIRETAHFSAAASDWSGIASYEWSFGDGTTATGASVEHTYSATGYKTVELRVTDRAGNVTTERRELFVHDPTQRIHVLPPGGPDVEPDRQAPAATLKAPKKVKLKAFLKGVKITVSANESVDAEAELLGTARGAKLAGSRYNVVLAERASTGRGREHALALKPNRRLVGRAKKLNVQLRVRVTDAAGNRRTVTQTIAVK